MSSVLEKNLPNNWIIKDLENILTELISGSRPKGGVNGIGVKAVNIYSNKFILET